MIYLIVGDSVTVQFYAWRLSVAGCLVFLVTNHVLPNGSIIWNAARFGGQSVYSATLVTPTVEAMVERLPEAVGVFILSFNEWTGLHEVCTQLRSLVTPNALVLVDTKARLFMEETLSLMLGGAPTLGFTSTLNARRVGRGVYTMLGDECDTTLGVSGPSSSMQSLLPDVLEGRTAAGKALHQTAVFLSRLGRFSLPQAALPESLFVGELWHQLYQAVCFEAVSVVVEQPIAQCLMANPSHNGFITRLLGELLRLASALHLEGLPAPSTPLAEKYLDAHTRRFDASFPVSLDQSSRAERLPKYLTSSPGFFAVIHTQELALPLALQTAIEAGVITGVPTPAISDLLVMLVRILELASGTSLSGTPTSSELFKSVSASPLVALLAPFERTSSSPAEELVDSLGYLGYGEAPQANSPSVRNSSHQLSDGVESHARRQNPITPEHLNALPAFERRQLAILETVQQQQEQILDSLQRLGTHGMIYPGLGVRNWAQGTRAMGSRDPPPAKTATEKRLLEAFPLSFTDSGRYGVVDSVMNTPRRLERGFSLTPHRPSSHASVASNQRNEGGDTTEALPASLTLSSSPPSIVSTALRASTDTPFSSSSSIKER